MEQKQLDEIDESYFGEEFIDENIDENVDENSEDDKIEAEAKDEEKPKKTQRGKVSSAEKSKTSPETTKKTKTAKTTAKAKSSKDAEKRDEIKVEPAAQKAKRDTHGETVSDATVTDTATKSETENSIGESKPTDAPVDPWADDSDAGEGLFTKVSTWKTVTGILIVLLAFSIFTQGFKFTDGNAITGAAVLSLPDAEQKALDFVNTNLLQPPFVAESAGTEEVKNLYKITLSVAGQTIDSYITKDGELFFPQGFPTEVTDAVSGRVNVQAGDEGRIDETSDGAQQGAGESAQAEAELVINIAGEPVLGDENAPVTIVEFSDFQCSYCARFNEQTLQQIKSNYVDTGKAKLVFRNFPLGSHSEAEPAALAAACADEQGKFWEYHDLLFENQGQLNEDNYKKWAADLGLSSERFDSCLATEKYKEDIQKDLSEGQGYGISGTPAFFINGELLSGALPFTAFEQEIEAALALASAPTAAEEPLEIEVVEELSGEEAAVEVVAEETKEFTLKSKKWSFAPDVLKVKQGDSIKLTIQPDGSNPTFALPEFTFAIPELDVKGEIAEGEPTTVEFTASKAGSFEFTCSSCEEWRGMSGVLVVE